VSKALQLHPLLLLGGLLSLLLALAGGPARAQELRPVPVLTQQVIDQTGTLSAAQREALTSKLERFERENGSQLVILIVASSQPEDIAAFAQRVGDAWKIGRKDVGDGLLIVVAKNDRKVRIEVAKALEGAVPDLAARQIIQSALSPAFKAGDYAGGLNQAVDQLQARIRGEALPAPTPGVAPAPAAPGASGFDFRNPGRPLLHRRAHLGGPVEQRLRAQARQPVHQRGGGLGRRLDGLQRLDRRRGRLRGLDPGGRDGCGQLDQPQRAAGSQWAGWHQRQQPRHLGRIGRLLGRRRQQRQRRWWRFQFRRWRRFWRRRRLGRLVMSEAATASKRKQGWLRWWRHRWMDSRDAERALPDAALARIEALVRASEARHQGQICVCVEAGLPTSYLWKGLQARDRAITLFGKLRVWDTEANNGVLIYLLLADRAIEVVADRGLKPCVSPQQWQALVGSLGEALKAGQFEPGLAAAVNGVSELLCQHFPLRDGETARNELPDAVLRL